MFAKASRCDRLKKVSIVVLLALFVINNLVSAQPLSFHSARVVHDSCAPQSILHPIVKNFGIQYRKQVEFEISNVIAMAMRGLKNRATNQISCISFLDINSALDKMCDNSRYVDLGLTESTIELTDNPEILSGDTEGLIVIHLRTKAGSDCRKYFKIIFKGNKLEDISDAGKFEIVEQQPPLLPLVDRVQMSTGPPASLLVSQQSVEDVLLADDGLPDPEGAWVIWREYIDRRPAREILYGMSNPENREGIEIDYRLMTNYEEGLSCLVKGNGKGAYELAKNSIRIINAYPYKYDETILGNLRLLYAWSHHICFGHFSASPIKFASSEWHNFSQMERLLIIDIDYQLSRGGPVTEDEWYDQIVFWHDLFIDVEVYPERLRDGIRDWLIDLDRPKEVLIDGEPHTITFADSPFYYIYAAYDYMFGGNPPSQPFEDGNHRAGCAVLNYLLAKHLGMFDFEIFQKPLRYGKYDNRKIVKLRNLRDGSSYEAPRLRFESGLKKIFKDVEAASRSRMKPEGLSITQPLTLMNHVYAYIKGHPVDEAVDLSLIPEENLTSDMRTWAYIMALNNKYGLDVKYRFISDDKAYEKKAKDVLLKEMNKIKLMETRRARGLIIDTYRPNAIQVHIMKKDGVERLKDIPKDMLIVALSDGTVSAGTPLRDFVSASAIGLAQAACKRMRMRNEPNFSEILEQTILPQMQRIYQRLFPEKDIKEIVTKETILNMIDDNVIVRKNLAVALALPPIAKLAIQCLKDYHKRVHELLDTAV